MVIKVITIVSVMVVAITTTADPRDLSDMNCGNHYEYDYAYLMVFNG